MGRNKSKMRTARQEALFGEAFERQSRLLPVIGEQKDIRYYRQFEIGRAHV